MTETGTGASAGWSGAALTQVRRVVTGSDGEGRSTVLFDGPAPHTVASEQFPTVSNTLWFSERHETLDAVEDNVVGRAGERPAPGMARFYVVRIDPGTSIDMHAHPTVDFHCVVDGEITCTLDVGEVTVRAGDVLVMRGSNHGWVNRGTVPFLSVAVMVDTAA